MGLDFPAACSATVLFPRDGRAYITGVRIPTSHAGYPGSPALAERRWLPPLSIGVGNNARRAGIAVSIEQRRRNSAASVEGTGAVTMQPESLAGILNAAAAR